MSKIYFWFRVFLVTALAVSLNVTSNVRADANQILSDALPLLLDSELEEGNAIHLTDFNGDGNIDVVAGGNLNGQIRLYQNTGAIVVQIDLVTGGFVNPTAFESADMDGDGDIDIIALGDNAMEVVWWQNPGNAIGDDGLPLFLDGGNWIERFADSRSWDPVAVGVADFDSDGDPDLVVVSNADNLISFLENPGGVLAESEENWQVGRIVEVFRRATDVVVGDIDQDGDIDFAATARDSDAVSWFVNPGGLAARNLDAWSEVRITSSFNGAEALALADIDNDGDPDIAAVASGEGELSWFENPGQFNALNSSLWIENEISDSESVNGVNRVDVGDFDADGNVDIVIATRSSTLVSTWTNPGPATADQGDTWEECEVLPQLTTIPVANFDIDVADFNGDMVPDLGFVQGGNRQDGLTADVVGIIVGTGIAPPLMVSAILQADDGKTCQLKWNSIGGAIYEVQETSSIEGAWETINLCPSQGTVTTFDVDMDPAKPRNFWRIKNVKANP